MKRLAGISNATKANIIAAVNALLGVIVLFGVELSADQIAAILTATNAVLAVLATITRDMSALRVEHQELLEQVTTPSPTVPPPTAPPATT